VRKTCDFAGYFMNLWIEHGSAMVVDYHRTSLVGLKTFLDIVGRDARNSS